MEDQHISQRDERAERKAEQARSDRRAHFRRKWRTIGKFVAAIAAVALVIIGLIMLAEREERASQASPLSNTVTETDHVAGNRDAKLTLVEYSDFQCPACRSYAPVIEDLIEEYGDRVLFVYRHFPLSSIHPNAEDAARASEAASAQGKFWEYANLLFTNQDEWKNANNPLDFFKEYATELGLDVNAFEDAYRSSEAKAKVNADYRSGLEGKVSGTPTFFLNGQPINNPRGYEPFAALLDAKLAELGVTETTDSGTEIEATEE